MLGRKLTVVVREHLQSILVRLDHDILDEHHAALANVVHAMAPAMDLGNINATLRRESDRGWILRLRLVGPKLDGDVFRHLESPHPNLGFLFVILANLWIGLRPEQGRNQRKNENKSLHKAIKSRLPNETNASSRKVRGVLQ